MSPSDSPRIRILHVQPRLPEPLEPLLRIAHNLYWSWSPEAWALFQRLDPALWDNLHHNPIRLLARLPQARLDEAATDGDFLAHMERVRERFRAYRGNGAWFPGAHADVADATVAYFSAEFGITECLPIYSGGLGVLAGDHLKAASDRGVPLVAVGLAYHEGYFRQVLNTDGWQQERYPEVDFVSLPLTLERAEDGEPITVEVPFPARPVVAQVWRAEVGRVPLYLLDTNVPANDEADRAITRRLYGGDSEMRIRQEIVLGIGGLRALAVLDIHPDVCHMNEGHAAFLALERIRRLRAEKGVDFATARAAVQVSNVFTTHTPVPAGFDLFDPSLVQAYFEGYAGELGLTFDEFLALGQAPGNDTRFNMALLAARLATHRNGVSALHGEVSRRMMRSWWPGLPVDEVPVHHVTNGVHMRTWISPEIQGLLDEYVGNHWWEDPADSDTWSGVDRIPDERLWEAHLAAKERLVAFARGRMLATARHHHGSPTERARAREVLRADGLVIGFARRFAAYKRADLLFRDLDRLFRILGDPDRPVQFVFAGKAHPADDPGKEIIKRIVHMASRPEVKGRIVFLEDYDIQVGRHLVQGVDVWLNNPRRPLEASGTSGMKAAANGVLNLSVLDGWWDEGYDPEVGWAIGAPEEYPDDATQDAVEASSLYDLLEREVVPLYYQRDEAGRPREWISRMKASVRQLCWRFNTNRMVTEYADRFYVPAARSGRARLADDLARARDVAAWSQRIRDAWDGVKILEVTQDDGDQLHVGEEVAVRARVQLGDLTPEDVAVELVHGPLDTADRVHASTACELVLRETRDGESVFTGTLVPDRSGLYGYGVRVRPTHEGVAFPDELARVAWAGSE